MIVYVNKGDFKLNDEALASEVNLFLVRVNYAEDSSINDYVTFKQMNGLAYFTPVKRHENIVEKL